MTNPGRMMSSQFASWLIRAFGSPRLPYALGLLAVLLTLPAIGQGWVADDLLHRKLLLTQPLSLLLRDLFAFVHPNPALQNADLSIELGTMPWWTLRSLRIAFFRPLGVLTHWVDYRLWPNSSALMYFHNILWYGLACVLAAVYYRRLMPAKWIAGMAAFLFALDVVHLGAVAWLANRNALMALVFGLAALIMHDRWRRDGWQPGAAWSGVFLVMSLLSAEAGLATAAYLLAYSLFVDRGSWRARLGSLVPAVSVIILWRFVYQALGYGAWGSDFYIDPAGEPIRYLGTIAEAGPILLFGQWIGQVPASFNLLSLSAGHFAWLAAVAFLILVGVAFTPLIRCDPVARFWGLGMLLAVLPACSVILLSGRVLALASLGTMGLIALFIGGYAERQSWASPSGARHTLLGAMCWVLVGLHGVLSPFLMPVGTVVPGWLQGSIADVIEIGPLPDAEQRHVVIVNAPSPFNLIYLPSLRRERREPMPARLRVLAPGYAAVTVTRLDERTVRVRPEHGYLPRPGTVDAGRDDPAPAVHVAYMFQLVDRFFRGDAFPMALGKQVSVSDMRFEVVALTEDGRAAEATITFAYGLDDPYWTWLQWDWHSGRFVPFRPPAVGRIERIPGPF